MNDHDLPPDPDLDALPPELAEHPGPFFIEGVDGDGNVWSGPVERIEGRRAMSFDPNDFIARTTWKPARTVANFPACLLRPAERRP